MIRLGGIALRLLLPSLLLPVLAAAAILIGEERHPSPGFGGLWVIPALAFLFLLLGSMTLNAWLLLRHPATLSDRELPTAVSAVLAAQWVLVVVWSLGALAGSPTSAALVIPAGIAGLAVAVFILVLRRARAWGAPLDAAVLPRAGRVLAIAYLVLSAAAIAVGVLLPALGAGGLANPALGALLLLGLPSSHPLLLVVYLASLSGRLADQWMPDLLMPALLSLSVIANMVLVSVLLWSPTRRTALANWFFRLKGFAPHIPRDEGVSDD